MREPHYGHAGTVYDGKMYISGGITHDSFQKELLCYDPNLDTWEQRTPMTGNSDFESLIKNDNLSGTRITLYDDLSW